MLDNFTSHQFTEEGNPAGGHTFGVGFAIAWQNGPLGKPGSPERQEPNGAFVETIIAAAIDRLEFYQASRFASADNAEAIAHLNHAIECLNRRTQKRIEQQVEGTHEI